MRLLINDASVSTLENTSTIYNTQIVKAIINISIAYTCASDKGACWVMNEWGHLIGAFEHSI